ncbi:hypothetical protein C2S51_034033 [Perilla frutescens var. frutescens]|nr:hypothetical protein C2S51_034033 [Perilla frutescens var. frutescens]
MEQFSSSPAIDRYNPIITDSRRSSSLPSLTLNKKNSKLNHSNHNEININNGNHAAVSPNTWSCTKPGDFISPPGSTRYLLSEKFLFNALSDFDQPLKLFPAETSKAKDVQINDAKPDQVVVLRVSLHCRGCERKMRKHISRMEGVRSFNIDFAAKKVTVTGNVTPLEVLSSISKVKNAQLWAPTISSSEFKSPASAAWAPTDKGSSTTFVGVGS